MSDQDEKRSQQHAATGASSAPEQRGESAAPRFSLTAPTLELPKGGGAVRSIGDKFASNPATGTGSLTVPLDAPEGRGGFGPNLVLGYDSGNGNAELGIGWTLSTPSISRRTDKGLPRYLDLEESDTFVLGGDDLVRARTGDTNDAPLDAFQNGEWQVQRYRPRVEAAFTRIERWRHASTGEIHWRTTSRENVLSIFGRSPEARIADPENPLRVFSWLLEEVRDDRGNVLRYRYKAEDGAGVGGLAESSRFDESGVFLATAQRYLKRVQWGNRPPPLAPDAPAPTSDADYMFELVFDYGEHAAPSDLESGSAPEPTETRPWSVRKDALSTHRAGFEIRTYRLCRRILVFHRFPDLGGPRLVTSTDFGYEEGEAVTYLRRIWKVGYVQTSSGAYERKVLPPLELDYTRRVVHRELSRIDAESLRGIEGALTHGAPRFVDLDGEGLPGVLIDTERAWFYKANLGEGRLGPLTELSTLPSPADLRGAQQLLDLGGDGSLDLVQYARPLSGYFERTPEGTWNPFVALERVPNVDWNDPNLRFIDLDGDGLPDVLVSEHEAFVWYRSRGKSGFDDARHVSKSKDEQAGPAVVFADGTETIQLADMSGDGLLDIVRVRNGEVCYWPNQGHGRFGHKITLAQSPWFDHPERFDPKRVRLTDVDGSGPNDVVYLGSQSVDIYFNRAGNSLESATRVESLPLLDGNCQVNLLDLLGQGTTCLVWSSSLPGNESRAIVYVDLMGGTKPHVLSSIVNGMGAETRITYAPSTQYYLVDKANGRPWLTRLAFPVHVISRIEHVDRVADTRLVTTFAYHHGYFDGHEREFRGFACVEQWDAESFAPERGRGSFGEPATDSDPSDEALNLPPTRTVTWFHTGAWLERESLELALAKEYYALDPAAPLLPDTRIPGSLSIVEEREAARALRGRILRQEIYGEDGNPESVHPYEVSEHAWEVRAIQRYQDRHAVFFVHPRQVVQLHYERDPSDPRMEQELTLGVDEFGNVTSSARIAYPRRVPVEPEQSRHLALLSDHTYANVTSDGYRLGVQLDSVSYELTGLPAGSALLDFDDVKSLALSAGILPYEATPSGATEKRTVEHVRRRYYDTTNLPAPFPLGQVDARAIPYDSYRLALTVGLIEQAYNSDALRVTDAILEEGGYVRLDGDSSWWAPSGRYEPDATRFYLPVSFLDPFGTSTTLVYDADALLLTSLSDALGNVVHARNDYRVLGPTLITDPNGNRCAVELDAHGMVEKTALMGKEGANEGDTLTDPTTAIEYELSRYQLTAGALPAFTHTKARELHGASNTRFQETFTYWDGSGRVAMTKARAEPGDAPLRGPDGALLHSANGDLQVAPVSERWVGSGKTVFDNKGKPVKQYEPFFSATHEIETEVELAEWGVTPLLFHDPAGRLRRLELPHGGIRRISFGAWNQTLFDENDSVSDPGNTWFQARQVGATPAEQRAALLTLAHADTPTLHVLDALGRTFAQVERLGPNASVVTRSAHDIEGLTLSITDPLGRECTQRTYGVDGQLLRETSIDSGDRRQLADVLGGPLRSWDAIGRTVRSRHDVLRRLTHVHVSSPGAPEKLVHRIAYGESHQNPEADNLRGRATLTFDGAGLCRTDSFDFKGNLLSTTRVLARTAEEPDWSVLADLVSATELLSAAAPLLDSPELTRTFEYDALNRLIGTTHPDQSKLENEYNEAGLLERVSGRLHGSASATPYVVDIDYDAKGERERIELGNGTESVLVRDPFTSRLTRITTRRTSDQALLQDLVYTYDCIGNVVAVADDAQEGVYFGGQEVEASSEYTYDPLYRLTSATGREHRGMTGQPDPSDVTNQPLPHPNDTQALRRYEERFTYDDVGNVLQLIHDTLGAPGGWTRRHTYAGDNRIQSSSIPGDPANGPFSAKYQHDANGNLVAAPHLAAVEYTHIDRMRRVELGGGGVALYAYDAAGERVRKRVQRIGSIVEERVYLGDFEVYRRHDGNSVVLERHTLHVMDDERRIAMVETLVIDTQSSGTIGASRTRYQYGNLLDSAQLECDADGLAITYEEYHPYGTSAYRSARNGLEVSEKRYRYTGKERDEETGLYHSGARYYAAWLGRWTTTDPLGVRDATALGTNPYVYCRASPITRHDPDGRDDKDKNKNPPPPPKKDDKQPDPKPKAPDTLTLVFFNTKHGPAGGGRFRDRAKELAEALDSDAYDASTKTRVKKKAIEANDSVLGQVEEISKKTGLKVREIQIVGHLHHGLNLSEGEAKQLAKYVTPDVKIVFHGCLSCAGANVDAMKAGLLKVLPGARVYGHDVKVDAAMPFGFARVSKEAGVVKSTKLLKVTPEVIPESYVVQWTRSTVKVVGIAETRKILTGKLVEADVQAIGKKELDRLELEKQNQKPVTPAPKKK